MIAARLERCNNHWEDVFFITLARNFGFGLNGDAFEAWASRLPFRAIDKHRDNLFQVEAFFLGQAGLLDEELPDADGYYLKLQKEFRYLQHKFELPVPDGCYSMALSSLYVQVISLMSAWRQLANLYYKEQSLFSRIMEADTLEAVRKLLTVATSPYWEEHFNFRKVSSSCEKQVGKNAQNLIVINTVIPFYMLMVCIRRMKSFANGLRAF